MKDKLNIEKMADAINYWDVQKTFFKGDGKKLTEDDLLKKGLNEDDYPFTIRDFKKLGYGFSSVDYFCVEDEKDVLYSFNNEHKTIIIDSNNFSVKEYVVIVDMIRRHLESVGAGQFVSFGMAKDKEHTLYHEDSTAFGVWWEEFFTVYIKWLKNKKKKAQIQIFTDDYQTEDERYQTKDRVIHIVLF